MGRKRRVFSSSFKAKVALEATKGLGSISKLAQDHNLHPTQILSRAAEIAGRTGQVHVFSQPDFAA